MLGEEAVGGFAAVIGASFFFGSSFVPARSFEVHDGIVFNWNLCMGMLLSGMTFSMIINDWSAPAGTSPGFYVHPEGLLSGLLYQLATAVATQAVKKVGLGVYFTVHEFTNVLATLVIGFLGPSLGLPVTVPSDIFLALGGAFCIGLGMVPTMFMVDVSDESEHLGNRTDLDTVPENTSALLANASTPTPSVLSKNKLPGLEDLFIPHDDSELELEEPKGLLRQVSDLVFSLHDSKGDAMPRQVTWDASMLRANMHTWDGTAPPARVQQTL